MQINDIDASMTEGNSIVKGDFHPEPAALPICMMGIYCEPRILETAEIEPVDMSDRKMGSSKTTIAIPTSQAVYFCIV